MIQWSINLSRVGIFGKEILKLPKCIVQVFDDYQIKFKINLDTVKTSMIFDIYLSENKMEIIGTDQEKNELYNFNFNSLLLSKHIIFPLKFQLTLKIYLNLIVVFIELLKYFHMNSQLLNLLID